MLRSNSKSLGNHVVSPEKEKRKAAVGRICRKKGFKSGMKKRVGDGKLMIISITVSGIKMTITQLDNYARQFFYHMNSCLE